MNSNSVASSGVLSREEQLDRSLDLLMPNRLSNHSSLNILLEGKIFEEQPLGGISRIYHEILPRICQMDERVSFSISTLGLLRQSLPQHPRITANQENFPIDRFLRPQTVFWRLQDYSRARFQVASIQPDKHTIWHATYFQLPGWWQGPKVVSVYDLIHEKFSQFFHHNYDEILRKRKKHAILAADKVICISEAVRAEVLNTYDVPRERVVVTPLACGEIFRQLSKEEIWPDYRVDSPFFLYVGMRQHYKNFKTLLRAYSIWERRHEIKLLVVGAPWSKEEQAQIAAAGLGSNIILRSGVTDEELCALYNQALAFVYPSLSEGFGIPLLEAMACGCQIVASRIPVFIEVAKDIPIFFDPLNQNELVAALEAACSSKSSESKVDDILNRYSWDHTARETLRTYEELVVC